jgi:hypothetical protein
MVDAAAKAQFYNCDNPETVLEEIAGGELADQFFVGVEEVERWQVTAFYPADLAKNPVLQFVLVVIDNKEVQVD